MTIPYADSFVSSLLQWKGSLYKAVLKDLFVFYIAYYFVMAGQWFLFDDPAKLHFNKWMEWFERGTKYIPLTFLLGFFVAGIVARWWEQFNWISWPDKLMMTLGIVLGQPKHEAHRRTIARWSSLQAAIAWRMVSMRTKARFPTEKHLVNSNLMTEHELETFTAIEAPYGKWFTPTIWIANLLRKLHAQGDIDSVQLKIVLKQLMTYRDGFAMLMVYDWINIPLVYTQVVAIATYGYFMLCLVGRQPKLDENSLKNDATILFPIFTTLQFMFFMGWLKVGQYLMHPFGDDEDDFELNWILDRNIQTAYLISDTLTPMDMPIEDPFHGRQFSTIKMPHTRASMRIKDIEPKDNLAGFKITTEDEEIVDNGALLLPDDDQFRQLSRRLLRSVRKDRRSKSADAEHQDFAEQSAVGAHKDEYDSTGGGT